MDTRESTKGFINFLQTAFRSWSTNENSFLIVIAGILGVICGAAAVIFEWMIEKLTTFFLTTPGEIYADSLLYLYLIIPLTPVVGGLIIGLIDWWYPVDVKSASAAEVMKWTAADGGVVDSRVPWQRAITAAVFLGSGGSGGREGPIAQICGAFGSAIGQLFKFSSGRLRLLVGCGSAAGIAAAFNAPIAGVIFAVELVLGDFAVTSFLPIVISSVMATTTKRLIMGDIPAFEAPAYTLVSPWEIILYCILGILCGLVARLFYNAYFWAHDLFAHHVTIHAALKPALGGLVVGLIGIFLPEVFGNGYGVMDDMLDGRMIWSIACALIVFKIIATAICLGSGGAGGVFAPALFIGCMMGGVFGVLANALFPLDVASPGAYALVGIGSVMAAVAHAPLTNILMGYELTGNYQIILPIMTSCIMSTYVMTRFGDESLYTEKLRRYGIRLWRGRDLAVMDRIRVADVMTHETTSIPESMPFRSIMRLITTSRDSYFPVVDRDDKLVGIISMQNVREILLESEELADLVVAKEIATTNVVTVTTSNNLNDAMEQFAAIDIEQLPVVDSSDSRKVIGMISHRDVMATYKKEVLKKSS